MNATRIAESRAKHTKLLSDALVLQIEMKRAQLLSNGIDEDKLQDEISVLLMADLQQKQAVETNAVGNVLGDKVSQGLRRHARKRRENSTHNSIFGNGLFGWSSICLVYSPCSTEIFLTVLNPPQSSPILSIIAPF